jgi:hypothetical protein
MEIKDWTLREFARHALAYWPQECKAHKLPTSGCMPAVERWLESTGIGIPGFVDKVKTATGDRAWALYRCADHGWIPRAEAVELIKSAPGDRALALYRCAYQNWIPRAEAVELIKTAPGDRAQALYWCAASGWITYEEVKTYLETR